MAAVIEAPLAFPQKPSRSVWRETIELTQVPLRFAPEFLTSIDVMSSLRHKHSAVVYALAMKF